MSDAVPQDHAPPTTAGGLLRAARERSGMHIGLLATTLKVPVRKLELLESDRFEELHDATFVRALSLSVCRALRCDPGPVLAALPRQDSVVSTLEQVNRGMNARFSQRAGVSVGLNPATGRKVWWLVACAAMVAGAAWWAADKPWSPQSIQGKVADTALPAAATSAEAPDASASDKAGLAATPTSSALPLVQTVHGAPAQAASGAAPAMASSVSVTEPSWIEAADAQGRPIWARTLTPGEVVALEASGGLRLTIGNAAGTQLRWRGQAIDLAPSTRDNVARVELK